MTSRTSSDFRRDLAQLPATIRRQARDAYRLFKQNPAHPSLKFKKLPPHQDIWSIRITNDYRAIGRLKDDVLLGSSLDRTRITTKRSRDCNPL